MHRSKHGLSIRYPSKTRKMGPDFQSGHRLPSFDYMPSRHGVCIPAEVAFGSCQPRYKRPASPHWLLGSLPLDVHPSAALEALPHAHGARTPSRREALPDILDICFTFRHELVDFRNNGVDAFFVDLFVCLGGAESLLRS